MVEIADWAVGGSGGSGAWGLGEMRWLGVRSLVER